MPLVMTTNPDIAAEVQSLKDSETVQDMQDGDISGLLTDIGMVLQYAQHIYGPQAEPSTGQ